MLLLFPVIDIQQEKCLQNIHKSEFVKRNYSDNPIEMAVLWRGENAKVLHVVEKDTVKTGEIKNVDIIKKMISAVDIPIQIDGAITKYEQVKELLSIGIYRVVLRITEIQNLEIVQQCIKDFTTRKIIIGIDVCDGKIMLNNWKHNTNVDVLPFALQLKQLGVTRILYTDVIDNGKQKHPNFPAIQMVAEKTGIRITACGGISGFEDLMKMQELEKYGVDSLVIGRALYENRFSCQALWRMNEEHLQDLGPTRRI